MRYLLTPWTWNTDDPDGLWEVPGVIGGIDLRSIPQMSQAGGAPEGYSFAAFEATTPSAKDVDLGDSLGGLSNKAVMETVLGLGVGELLATNLLDALWELLTQHADPTGDLRWKPLMPTASRGLELRLGGHTLIKSDRFDPAQHPLVVKVAQEDYKRIREDSLAGLMRDSTGRVDEQFYLRYLQTLVEKYRLPPETFIPIGLPLEAPLPHKTTITDDFNRANESLDAGPWDEIRGNWSVLGNRARVDSSTGSGFSARHDTSLSGTDHFVKITVSTYGTGNPTYCGTAARFSTDVLPNQDYYRATARDDPSELLSYGKVVNGVRTALDADRPISTGAPDDVEIETDGSTMISRFNSAIEHNFTDVSLTTGLQTGMILFRGNSRLDDFLAEDLPPKRRRVGMGPRR